jgi:hypothetical protein
MIRINLLKNRSIASGGDTTYAITVEKGAGSEVQKEAVIKIMLMSVFTVILVFFESNNVDNLKKEEQVFAIQLEELQAKVKKLKEEASTRSLNLKGKEKSLKTR